MFSPLPNYYAIVSMIDRSAEHITNSILYNPFSVISYYCLSHKNTVHKQVHIRILCGHKFLYNIVMFSVLNYTQLHLVPYVKSQSKTKTTTNPTYVKEFSKTSCSKPTLSRQTDTLSLN
jgi:hypothetical protein